MNSKAYISLLYVNTNAASKESLAVGLLGLTGRKVLFEFSREKLLALRRLWSIDEKDELFRNIVNSLKSIKADVEEKNSANEHSLFELSRNYSKEYLEYLSKYSLGIFAFSKPSPVSTDLEEHFDRLFETYVGEKKEAIRTVKDDFRKKVNAYLERPEIKERADVHYKISPERVPSFAFEHEVDLLARNGSLYAGTAIDFKTSPDTIKRNLDEFNAVILGLNEFSKKEEALREGNRYEVFFNEPESKEGKRILDRLRKADAHYDVKEYDRLEKLGDLLEKEGYSKFSESF